MKHFLIILHLKRRFEHRYSICYQKFTRRASQGALYCQVCGSPTKKLLSYLDHYLRPIVEESASYIKDTNHFLQQIFEIHTSTPPNSWLVTLDVKSLYTNIPQDEGIKDKELKNIWSKTPILALQRHNKLGDWLTHTKF